MSSYGPDTTTDEILDGLDLTGRRFVVTGAASGLGQESARKLSAHGASVTVLARNRDRADGAARDVDATVPGADVDSGVVDLGDLASIRAFADSYLSDHDSIDVLLNNAGVMACPLGHTADGFETQFGTNHLGHFLLTARLLPALLAGDAPRVVTLSSAGHARSDVDLDDPNFERTEYTEWAAYGRSKSANALFARELASRYGGSGLLSYSVHPGMIVTELGRHLTDDLIKQMMAYRPRTDDAEAPIRSAEDAKAAGMSFKSVESGAATQLWGATSQDPDLLTHNGAYLANCGLGVAGADPRGNGYAPHIANDETATRLWELSERLVGEAFPNA